MTGSQIASLSLKLMGIFSIIQAVPILKDLSSYFLFKGSNFMAPDKMLPNYNYLLIGILTSSCLLILLGMYLIIYSDSLGKKIIKESNDTIISTDLSAKDLQAIAFSVIGVVMIVMAIPHLVKIATNIQALKMAGDEYSGKSVTAGTWAYAIGLSVQVVIGLLLFFGSRGLSSLWYFFQKTRPLKDVQ
jgi:hypothetical protein